MRKLGLLLLPFIILSSAYGQSTEFSVHFNSGLFSFGGESATGSSIIIASDVSSEGNYTNNPYGTKKKLSYGLTAQFQRITNYKLIFGLQSGYELLRTQVRIDDVAGDFPTPPSSASGQTTFKNGFIILYPNVGRRFIFNDLNIDLTVGPELGFNVVSREKGEATTNNNIVIKTDRERSHANTDFRLRSSLTVYYKNWGISTGYSYGLRNYSGDLIGGNRERFSRFIRFGVTYRLK
ncbi:MAG TPA: hypothetical protein VFM80_01130 [Gracilimonas sp.]|uniref:hypothetical protein n=1 Tax=Gracilimonas sp. TaxID=1974203 RepID=UPI002DA7B9ED|nr:hypothetical protein [Gracilimonas sp.]